MDVKSKIKYFMKAKNLNDYKLAQKSGLSQPTITNWFNSRNYTPSIEALEKVCSAFEITMAELCCTNDEKMMPVSDEIQELLNVWYILDKSQRDNFLGLMKSISKQ